MISELDHTASIHAVYASPALSPTPMQDSLASPWLAVTDRDSNPWVRLRISVFTYIPPFQIYPVASLAHARRPFWRYRDVDPLNCYFLLRAFATPPIRPSKTPTLKTPLLSRTGGSDRVQEILSDALRRERELADDL